MKYRSLGKSGLTVSEMGLGTNTFGGKVDERTSISIIERALDVGIDFIDTADAYTEGRSEEFVGKALKGKRSQVVIATKFGHPKTVDAKQRPGSLARIVKAVELSLRRLDTDFIDLY